MIFQLPVGLVVVSPDGGFLECAVHPLNLAVGPGVIGFGQAMLDAMFLAGPIEGVTAPPGGEAITVLGQVGELDAVVRCGSGKGRRPPVRQGRPWPPHPWPSSRKGVLAGPVQGHEEIEFAFLGATSAMSMWK